MSTRSTGRLIPLRRPEARDDALSEPGLIAACAAGDRAARAMLFERHADAIHRFATRLVGDADADDLVQATFLTAYRAAAKFAGASTVRTWLCGIAANLARTHVRGEVRRRVAMGAVAEITSDREPGVASAERRDLLARLPAAIAELKHDLRVAFVLCDLEGVRGAEAAQALGVPEGTLYRRLHEARAALRRRLGVSS